MEDKKLELKEIELEESQTEPIFFTDPYILDWMVDDNSSSFDEGIEISSKYAGFFSGLISNGMNYDDAVAMVFNYMSAENNLELALINKEAQIECAKEQSIMQERGSL